MRKTSWLFLILLLPFASCQSKEKDVCPRSVSEEMSCIPGGEFIYGSSDSRYPDENPETKVYVSTFLIDKYEVSNADYFACVQSGKCTHALSNYRQMRGETQPHLKANWFQAKAYCEAQGKRLPTEAEFEKAMRGESGEMFPWGNDRPDCSRAVMLEKGLRGCVGGYHEKGNTAPVGTKGSFRYGLYDMAGNAQEWVSDWYAADRTKCGEHCLGKDPKGPCAGADSCVGYSEKVVKGGSWYWGEEWLRGAKRRAYMPQNDPPHHFGFRCVKSVSQSD